MFYVSQWRTFLYVEMINNMEVKKFCTFDEQLENIRKKGFRISDPRKCMSFLKRNSYYSCSAYFHYFELKSESDLDFESIMKICEFDSKVRNLIFYIIEEIEHSLKTQISYFHAEKYGALGYLQKENFSKKYHDHEKFINMIAKHKVKNCKNDIIKHHNKNYDGNVPIWVMINFFTIGELVHFYKDMKTADRKAFLRDYIDLPNSFKYFDSWLKCITDVRNRCAHYSRLYFFNFPNSPKFFQDINIGLRYKLFEQILALKFVFHNKNRFNKMFVHKLKKIIDCYDRYIDLKYIGFPDNWFEILCK